MNGGKLPSQTIYTITHCGLSGLSNTDQVKRLLRAGARLIQIRDKENTGSERLELEVRRCAEMCREAGATLIVNDDARLCSLTGAHGLHVGQDDMPPLRAREIIGPDRILGISTHDTEQFDAALREPVDYIAVGPVFGTSTKERPDPATGLELVRYASQRIPPGKQLVAIGGIDKYNIAGLMDAAPDVIPAVIGCIMRAKDIEMAFRDLTESAGW